TIEMPVLGEHGDRHILLAWKPDSAETTEGLGNVIHLFVHEANNSLLPIASLASTVSSIARREIASAEAATEVGHALEVIHARALALARFLRACLDFADLPVTTSARFALRPIVERVAALETRLSVVVETQDDVELFGVRDEIEQVLINLVRNAADASLEAGGGVRIRWAVDRGMLDLRVIDDGAGEIDEQALFVPRRTTKRTGLGLGLVLSRYVAVNHGGSLHLQRRRELPGCEAVLRISVGPPLR
ncbi:MAG TPA: HAMP domain-containing sensor histidine kinase, partial [Thermoanaerobaculia bacterium]|nr:HAMP domain-containing sensor histidine kinase [Thermoanaerobaculia bacterium]